jgi:CRISPR-associated protein (Cas_Cas02710)
VDWEKLDEKVRKRFLEEAGLNEPPRVLALYHARLLDHILDGGTTEDEAVLRDLLQKRNYSILAHGLQPIEKKSTVRFLEYVDTLVKAPEARVGAEHARLRGL